MITTFLRNWSIHKNLDTNYYSELVKYTATLITTLSLRFKMFPCYINISVVGRYRTKALIANTSNNNIWHFFLKNEDTIYYKETVIPADYSGLIASVDRYITDNWIVDGN